MSIRSVIFFSRSLYSLDDLVPLQPGQLVEAQFEDGVDLLRADDVAVVGQALRRVDADAERLGLAPW